MSRHHPQLVDDLLEALGRSFDLRTRTGEETLGQAIRLRLEQLRLKDSPVWGSSGSMHQVAKRPAGGLDFYYRPHLFPDMSPQLRLGHQLQFDLLPRELPPDSPVKIAAVLESYCHLSGDLLGWRTEGDSLLLWIADISGHGVRAGLAAAVFYLFFEDLEEGLPLPLLAQTLNQRLLAARNPEDRSALFATVFWARFDRRGRGEYVSAGHPPMTIRRVAGSLSRLRATGRPVGLLHDQQYVGRPLRLDPGDTLFLFTDGLVEARDPSDREMGRERLARILEREHRSLRDLVAAVYEGVSEFTGSRQLDDDLTFLAARRNRS